MISQLSSYSDTTNRLQDYTDSVLFERQQISSDRFLNSDPSSTIAVALQGGLGNLLFQVAAALALSKIHNRKLLLINNQPPAHDAQSNNKLISLFKDVVVSDTPGEIWYEPDEQFATRCDLSFLNGRYETYVLHGYFQSSSYWEQYIDDVNSTLDQLVEGVTTLTEVKSAQGVWGYIFVEGTI